MCPGSIFCCASLTLYQSTIYRGGRQDWRRQDFSASDEGQSTLATPYEVSTTHDASQSKPITIKQQVLAAALDGDFRSPSPEPLTHVAEQDALRKETIAAFHTGEQDDEDDDLLVPREKTKDELEQEEEEYKEFLERQVGQDLNGLITLDEREDGAVEDEAEGSEPKGKKSKSKKDKKSKKSEMSKQAEDQEFLMKYALFVTVSVDSAHEAFPAIFSTVAGSTDLPDIYLRTRR